METESPERGKVGDAEWRAFRESLRDRDMTVTRLCKLMNHGRVRGRAHLQQVLKGTRKGTFVLEKLDPFLTLKEKQLLNIVPRRTSGNELSEDPEIPTADGGGGE